MLPDRDLDDLLAGIVTRLGDHESHITDLERQENGGIYINVRHYGARGDGITDDTVALQNIFDMIPNGLGSLGSKATIYFPTGNYCISNTLYCKNKYRLFIIGDGAIIQPTTGADFTGKTLFNFSGSAYSHIKGISFLYTAAINNPTACMIYGRNVAGTGGDVHFEDCGWYGNCTYAVVLFAQGDTSSFKNCIFQTRNINPCLFLTSHNDSGYLDKADSTHTLNIYEGCWFYSTFATTTRLIAAQGLIQNLKFDTCFLSPTGAVCFSAEDSALAGTANQIHKLSFINCQCEGNGAGARLLKVGNSYNVQTVDIVCLGWDTISDYVIDVDSLVSTNGLKNLTISPQISLANAATKIIHLINGRLDSSHIACASDDIYTEVGTLSQYNFFEGVYGGSPLGASLGTLENNIVISGGLALMTLSGIGYTIYNVPDDGAAMVDARTSTIIFNASVPTTISNFAPYTPGMIIHCICLTGNTTIKNNANIHLRGGIDLNVPIGTTLTLLNTSGWEWYEI